MSAAIPSARLRESPQINEKHARWLKYNACADNKCTKQLKIWEQFIRTDLITFVLLFSSLQCALDTMFTPFSVSMEVHESEMTDFIA